MFTDLEKQYDRGYINSIEKNRGIKERAEFGICESDLRDFSSYLDEVILNALEDIRHSKHKNIPIPYSAEEWDNILDELIEIAQGIVSNNYSEYLLNMSCAYYNNQSKYDDLEADSYALRKKLYTMLGEHITDLYTL